MYGGPARGYRRHPWDDKLDFAAAVWFWGLIIYSCI